MATPCPGSLVMMMFMLVEVGSTSLALLEMMMMMMMFIWREGGLLEVCSLLLCRNCCQLYLNRVQNWTEDFLKEVNQTRPGSQSKRRSAAALRQLN